MSVKVEALFLENDEELVFNDARQLSVFLDYVFSKGDPWKPPGRNSGRTTAHRERYCLRYFLAAEQDAFDYPIAIRKTERPDFLVEDEKGAVIGVEHTDAGPEAYQRWLAQTEQEDGALFASGWDGTENSEGFAGDQMYREAVDDLVAALNNKIKSINKQGYSLADEFVLVIYLLSNAPLFFDGDFDRILSRLPRLQKIQTTDQPQNFFDRVLIILGDEARYWPVEDA